MNQEELRKETAVKIAKKHGLYHSFTGNIPEYAIDALLEMAQWEAERDKWISVTDRYPSEDEEVNVYFEYKFEGRETEIGVTSATYETQKTLRPCFYQVNGNVVIGVTMWQPLPTPPKTSK